MKPKFITIGKDLTDHIIFTCKIFIKSPLCCLGYDSTFLLRDPEANLTLGIGKVLKQRPCERDPDLVLKEYRTSVLHRRLCSSLKKIRMIQNSIDQKDEVAQLNEAIQLFIKQKNQ